MKITYIYHSGFLVETTNYYYLFDYYKGTLPPLQTDKPILVFASHSHRDHYNPEIFTLLKQMGMEQITAVLAKDISPRKYSTAVENMDIVKVTFHQTYTLPGNTTLETLHSTDAGVAFLVQGPEGNIYHAGDLNDWTWSCESDQYNRQMTGSYRHEIDLIKDTQIDIAFLPLYPRQEAHYAKGMLYFLKKIRVKQVYPMHYWEQPQVISRFLQEYPGYETIVQDTEHTYQYIRVT